MKDYFRLSLVLFIICLISAALLSLVNSNTQPIRAKILADKELNAKIEVFPDSKKFLDLVIYKGISFYPAVDESGKIIGAVIKSEPKGYSGPITYLFGIQTDGKITGVKILSHTETPGLGSKMEEINQKKSFELKKNNNLINPNKPWFQEQFKKTDYKTLAVKKDGGQIDSITAATISSRAVTNGLKQSAEKFFQWLNKN